MLISSSFRRGITCSNLKGCQVPILSDHLINPSPLLDNANVDCIEHLVASYAPSWLDLSPQVQQKGVTFR